MNLITQSKFKDLISVTKQAVNQLVKSGKLTVVKEGKFNKIDLDGALTQQYLSERQIKQAESKTEYTPEDAKTITNGANPGTYSEKRSLEIDKLKEQTEEIRIKNQIKRGDLVEKKLIKKVFDRLYSIDQAQFKPLGVNISPKISAVYNTGNAEKTLQVLELVHKQNDPELKSEIRKILNAGEPDRINEMNQIIEDATGSILVNVQREINKFLDAIGMETE